MSKPHPQDKLLSIVVPVYNESDGLTTFHQQLNYVLKELDRPYEILYVDDGSLDDSANIIQDLARHDSKVRPIYLSRNFGKELATTAGLHAAKGAAAHILDADGQHPVSLIPLFIEKWQAGAKVVIGIRTSNQKEGFVKKQGSKSFYALLKLLRTPDVRAGSTDFRLVDRQVIDAFKKLTEHNRITRSLIDWLGFERTYIEFNAHPRKHGDASYSVRKLIQLALNGFVSLSFTPLYLSGYIGVFVTLLSSLLGIFAVFDKYIFHDPFNLNISGTAILAVFILFMVGILLIGQGLVAVYIARIYTDVQGRPLYVVKGQD